MKQFFRKAVIALALIIASRVTQAQTAAGGLAANQTQGYANGKVLTFTYTQNFACVEQPGDDPTFNGVTADQPARRHRVRLCRHPSDLCSGTDVLHQQAPESR